MSEARSTLKGTVRKNKADAPTSRSFLHIGSTPSTAPNLARLSLRSNARLQKTHSLEKLSFVSEKEENDLENYNLEYSTYLLRKLQNRILTKVKEEKEEQVQKCFVSIKLELEELLEKYVGLSKEIGYFKIFFEILTEINKKIEEGKKVLKVLKENDFEGLIKSLSNYLDYTINQLQLVGIDKGIIDDVFSKGVWGFGSEIDECLRKIDSTINRNKEEVSKIAAKLIEIKKLSVENSMLRERFEATFEKITDEILETNYKTFTNVVKEAFCRGEEDENEPRRRCLDCDLGFLEPGFKASNTFQSCHFSKLESPYPSTPNSASTPHQN